MSAEGPSSAERTSKQGKGVEMPSSETVAPVIIETDGEAPALNAVRARLGMSRREALFAGMGAAIVAAADVRAEEIPNRLERQSSFEDGLAFLRDRARTQDSEELYLYVEEGQYARWVEIPGSTSGMSSEQGGAVLFSPSNQEFVHRMRHMVEEGSTVHMVHTHPTPLLVRESGNPEEMVRRVPPSGTDVVNMIATERPLSEAERDRLSFSVVSEEGRWIYESELNSVLERSLAAADPHLSQLEREYAPHAPEAGREFREAIESYDVEGYRGALRSIERSMRQGSYVESLRSNPMQLVLHAGVMRGILLDENLPAPVRIYMETVVRAADALEQAARDNDPDGHNFSELAGAAPLFDDIERGFTQYQEFWKNRGVTLTFEPF